MSDKEILIAPTEALAQITALQQKLESDLQWLASKHSDIGNVLSKSQGDFATQLKSHLQNESDLMVEIGSYYRQLASVLTHTVNEYSRVDNELSKSYGLNQEGGSQ